MKDGNEELCQCKRCRRPYAMTYLGVRLCEQHWALHCKAEAELEAQARAEYEAQAMAKRNEVQS